MENNDNAVFAIEECYIGLIYSVAEYINFVCKNNHYECCYLLKYLLDNDLLADTNLYDDSNCELGYSVFLGNNNYVSRLNFMKDVFSILGFVPSIIEGVIKSTCFCEKRSVIVLRSRNKLLYFDVISGKIYGVIENMVGFSMDFSSSFVPDTVTFEQKLFAYENAFDFDVDTIDTEEEVLYIMKAIKASNTLEKYEELKTKVDEFVKTMKSCKKRLVLEP